MTTHTDRLAEKPMTHPFRAQPMSTLDMTQYPPPSNLHELPSFTLRYLADETERPEEITIFSPEMESLTTTWITIDAEHAIALEDTQ